MNRVAFFFVMLFCIVAFCSYAKGQYAVSNHMMDEINQAIMEKQLTSEPYLIISHWDDVGKWTVDTAINKAPEHLFNFRNDAKINERLWISPIDTLFFLESLSADKRTYVFNKKTALFIEKVDTIHNDSVSHYYTIRQHSIESKYNRLYRHIIEWDTTSLRSYKYNPMVFGEFYSWYLTRVCIEYEHVSHIDFIILPDENFWTSASTLTFNNLLEQRCKSGTTMNIENHHRANGCWFHNIRDYLGNVRTVIDGQGALEEVNNYYPYGALVGGGTVGNNTSVQPYKYGGKELDRQNGLDWYDSQARMYDPLLGRTPTMDSKAENYYPISPYAWCAGNPVRNIDPDGNIIRTYINGQAYDYQMGKDGTYGFYNQDGVLYGGPNSFMFDLTSSLQSLQNGWFGKIFIADLINSSNVVKVKYGKNNSTSTDDNTIFWNSDNTAGGLSFARDKFNETRPAFIGLGHELAHISDAWFGSFDESPWYVFNNKSIDKTEIYASQIENVLRQEHGVPIRTHYSYSKEIWGNCPFHKSAIPTGAFLYYRPFYLRPITLFIK